MTIWGNTIVKNEGRYVWFAIKSVIDYLDKMLIWDTGSSDDTVEVIQILQRQYPKKIEFREVGEVDSGGLTMLRQKMLDETKSDWFLILDGDEVWWKGSIKKVVAEVRDIGNKYAIVNPVINAIGDIYHYQEEKAGKYEILGKKGHLNIRVINKKITGLHISGRYPLEGYYDADLNLIQTMDSKLKFLEAPLLHLTHLNRSSKGKSKKIKYELGNLFPDDFKYPEVFYLKKPAIVPSPWVKMPFGYKFRASLETPLKKLKRRIR